MHPIAMTLVAPASEPSQHEARSHAIKNCVSVILVLATTIERYVDPVARARVTRLLDASRRLRELLESKPRLGVREEVRISDVLQLVVARLEPQAEARGVQVAAECAGGTLHGDLVDLAEALYNIGSNALYASPSGSTVRITTRTSLDGDHEWKVEDAGCGIPASVMSRLGVVGMTTRDDGSGLGLSLALQVIAQHDGVMRVESLAGSGTTVVIWLPASSTSKA
jgi:signal transduction histidine kinase